MPNKKSAMKELRKSKKLYAKHSEAKEEIKNLRKKAVKAIEAGADNAKELTEKTFKALDKAAGKGVIKKNTANRKKSRLHQKLNQKTK